jgi:hypothetical protein
MFISIAHDLHIRREAKELYSYMKENDALVLEKENCVPKNKSYEAIGGQEASGTQWR